MPYRRGLSDLIRARHLFDRMAAAGGAGGAAPDGEAGLEEVREFGADPGALRMLALMPPGLPAGAPLVVVLHGCTQTAAGFALGCGWSDLARRHGFALLAPEQRPANNAQRCFSWFEPGDTTRGAGESGSIRAMVAEMLERHALDRRRVFVAGLSAGGAMAASLLAAYPEVFAGGAIVGGLPHGSAAGVAAAFEAMSRPAPLPAAARAAAVRDAAPGHAGPWPRVAIWHGTADSTVAPGNAEESAKQWRALHGLDDTPSREQREGAERRRLWLGRDGRPAVALHLVEAMGHGVPLDPAQAGRAGPFLLDVGISAPERILEFWGLAAPGARRPAAAEAAPPPSRRLDPAAVIDRALRAAGLR